jgi:hypothetical protein
MMLHAHSLSLSSTASTFPEANLLDTNTLIAFRIRLQLVDVQHKHVTLHVHEHEARCVGVFLFACSQGLIHPAVRAGGTAGVDEELALHLVCLELAGAAPAEDVDVHLPRRDQQRIWVSGRDNAIAVREADAQAAMSDDFGQSGGDWEAGLGAGGLLLAVGSCWSSGAHGDVKIAFDELEIGRDAFEEGVDGGRCEVSQTEDLADLAGCEELLELECGLASEAVGSVDVLWSRFAYFCGNVLAPAVSLAASWLCAAWECLGSRLRGPG